MMRTLNRTHRTRAIVVITTSLMMALMSLSFTGCEQSKSVDELSLELADTDSDARYDAAKALEELGKGGRSPLGCPVCVRARNES